MHHAQPQWKTGSRVRLASGSEILEVIGHDSVGSVICRPLDHERCVDLYVASSLLVAVELHYAGEGTF